ncbi:MAG: hypothetical protein DYG98_09095 [Haliscomenobacteraceae bacterium CHB4]|nr:hypothetical protein [Haliscomenobacteraceae bacterium CHB4]
MLCLIRHTLEAQFQTDFFINFFLPMKQFNLIFDNRPPPSKQFAFLLPSFFLLPNPVIRKSSSPLYNKNNALKRIG